MTEAEWLSIDLAARYSYLLPRYNGDELSLLPRRGRLLWVAWARTMYSQLPWAHRLEIEYAERLADDPALTRTELRSALAGGLEGIDYHDHESERALAMRELEARLKDDFGLRPCGNEPPYEPTAQMLSAIARAGFALKHQTPPLSSLPTSEVFADYFHDIFGNPFRPVAFSPAWRTDTAVAIARRMYDSRDFGAMPILADALQDAGCEDEHILNHCRDANTTHVRGCWVVDLVLGKE